MKSMTRNLHVSENQMSNNLFSLHEICSGR